MHLLGRKSRKRRRHRLSGEWNPGQSADHAENELFDASFELAEAARDLAITAGIRGTAPVTAATLGATVAALESQADAMERMRSLVNHELALVEPDGEASPDLQQLHRLLGSVEETLRFAAEEADRARESASLVLSRAPVVA